MSRKKKLPKGIREKENGSFIVDVTVNNRRVTKTLKTLPEALRVLAEIQLGQNLAKDKNITLSQAIDHCMNTQWLNSRSLESIMTAINHFIEYFGENYKLNNLNAGVVSDFAKHLLKAGKKPSSINQYLVRLSTICYRAYEDGFLDEPVKIRRLKVRSSNKAQLSEEIFKSMVEYFNKKSKNVYTDILYILYYTGMRISEVLNLTEKNIDLKSGMLTIWENKTDNPRTIPILTEIQPILSERINKGFFKGVSYQAFLSAFNCAKKRLGINQDITPHSFRHFFLSNLAKKNANASLIQAWAGHKSIVTSQRYIHLSGADLKRFAQEHLEGV